MTGFSSSLLKTDVKQRLNRLAIAIGVDTVQGCDGLGSAAFPIDIISGTLDRLLFSLKIDQNALGLLESCHQESYKNFHDFHGPFS